MKVIIWDADETLWYGTIYNGESVTLKSETKEVLKQISKLGIKQVVCSHNEQNKVEDELKKQGIIDYFTFIYASTILEKSEMIKSMLTELKIDPVEALFIDDTPINRAIVHEKLGVHVDYFTDLYEIFKYIDTERLVLMNQQRNRETAEKNWKGDMKEFLKTVNNTITIKSAELDEVKRITDLANRTNELNSTRTRYTEDQIKQFMSSNNYIVKVAYLSDIYGQYGLIGEIICSIDNESIFIQDICVSCRTMGRGVGKALIDDIKSIKGKKKLKGVLIPNEYNGRMKALFESCGFKETTKSMGKIFYELI